MSSLFRCVPACMRPPWTGPISPPRCGPQLRSRGDPARRRVGAGGCRWPACGWLLPKNVSTDVPESFRGEGEGGVGMFRLACFVCSVGGEGREDTGRFWRLRGKTRGELSDAAPRNRDEVASNFLTQAWLLCSAYYCSDFGNPATRTSDCCSALAP